MVDWHRQMVFILAFFILVSSQPGSCANSSTARGPPCLHKIPLLRPISVPDRRRPARNNASASSPKTSTPTASACWQSTRTSRSPASTTCWRNSAPGTAPDALEPRRPSNLRRRPGADPEGTARRTRYRRRRRLWLARRPQRQRHPRPPRRAQPGARAGGSRTDKSAGCAPTTRSRASAARTRQARAHRRRHAARLAATADPPAPSHVYPTGELEQTVAVLSALAVGDERQSPPPPWPRASARAAVCYLRSRPCSRPCSGSAAWSTAPDGGRSFLPRRAA